MEPVQAWIIRIAYGGVSEVEEIKNVAEYVFIHSNMVISLLDGKTFLRRSLNNIIYWEKVKQPITNPDKKIHVVNEDKK